MSFLFCTATLYISAAIISFLLFLSVSCPAVSVLEPLCLFDAFKGEITKVELPNCSIHIPPVLKMPMLLKTKTPPFSTNDF
ncbi:hypothetical protein QBC42DRAFT_267757 [Cladorrhinum samala]|uniref:Secreted protein n=1 Tax=Cladorrhinum samala TaxID=585594 RepID=A0AAV9HRT3_9PEZI|nr:hypothetical protein QBC42DRAFT_267757 [Cladorrhinum samala]